MSAAYDAVILAGGRATRMGGADKTMMAVAGRPLLWHAIGAAAGARTVVVVGPPRPVPRPDVVWAREEPVFSGPLAALAAGAARTERGIVVVISADTFVDGRTVQALVRELGRDERVDAVVGHHAGSTHPLTGAYRREALLAALARVGDPADRAVRDLGAHLAVAAVEVPGLADADSWDDLAALRAGRPGGSAMLDSWTEALGAELGLDPVRDPIDVPSLLDLAAEAAHAVARPAAPVTTFLVGYAAGREGGGPEAVAAAARKAAALAQRWEPDAPST